VGSETDGFYRDYRELVGCAELVGLLRGCVCGWRHCETATSGLLNVLETCIVMTLFCRLGRVLLGSTVSGWMFFFVFYWGKPFSVGLVDQLVQSASNQVETVEKALAVC